MPSKSCLHIITNDSLASHFTVFAVQQNPQKPHLMGFHREAQIRPCLMTLCTTHPTSCFKTALTSQESKSNTLQHPCPRIEAFEVHLRTHAKEMLAKNQFQQRMYQNTSIQPTFCPSLSMQQGQVLQGFSVLSSSRNRIIVGLWSWDYFKNCGMEQSLSCKPIYGNAFPALVINQLWNPTFQNSMYKRRRIVVQVGCGSSKIKNGGVDHKGGKVSRRHNDRIVVHDTLYFFQRQGTCLFLARRQSSFQYGIPAAGLSYAPREILQFPLTTHPRLITSNIQLADILLVSTKPQLVAV